MTDHKKDGIDTIIYKEYYAKLKDLTGDELLDKFDDFSNELNQLVQSEETRANNRRKKELSIGLDVIDDIMNEAGDEMSGHTMTLELKKDTFEQELMDIYDTQATQKADYQSKNRKAHPAYRLGQHLRYLRDGFNAGGKQTQRRKINRQPRTESMPPGNYKTFKPKQNRQGLLPKGCLNFLLFLFIIIIIIWLLPNTIYIPSFNIPGTEIQIDGNILTRVLYMIKNLNPF